MCINLNERLLKCLSSVYSCKIKFMQKLSNISAVEPLLYPTAKWNTRQNFVSQSPFKKDVFRGLLSNELWWSSIILYFILITPPYPLPSHNIFRQFEKRFFRIPTNLIFTLSNLLGKTKNLCFLCSTSKPNNS